MLLLDDYGVPGAFENFKLGPQLILEVEAARGVDKVVPCTCDNQNGHITISNSAKPLGTHEMAKAGGDLRDVTKKRLHTRFSGARNKIRDFRLPVGGEAIALVRRSVEPFLWVQKLNNTTNLMPRVPMEKEKL